MSHKRFQAGHFDGHVAVKQRVMRPEDNAETATAQFAEDLIPADVLRSSGQLSVVRGPLQLTTDN
jgi:hypothetical protein